MDYHRRSIRLDGYDYSQKGWYFVTICVQDRICFFENIVDGKMKLNVVGEMIQREWVNIPSRFVHVKLGAFVVMPNHFHGMIKINNCVGAIPCGCPKHNINNVSRADTPINTDKQNVSRADTRPPMRADTRPAPTIGDIVCAFKSITTCNYIYGVGNHGWPPFNKRLWQRNYWEHIIQDEKDHYFHEEYIKNNPMNWEKDTLFFIPR